MSECRRYMDDYPGARAECARNIAAGKLCHDCPKQPDSKESLLSENTALRAERDALVRERDEARDELLLTTRLDAELAMQRRAERAEADLAAARDNERNLVAAWQRAIANNETLRADLAAARTDAERYRWLRDQRDDDGCVIVMKNKHFVDDLSCEANIDRYIDSAIAASRKGSNK